MLKGSREREGGEVQKDIYVYLPYVYILRISLMMMIDTSPFRNNVYLGIASNMSLFCRQ